MNRKLHREVVRNEKALKKLLPEIRAWRIARKLPKTRRLRNVLEWVVYCAEIGKNAKSGEI